MFKLVFQLISLPIESEPQASVETLRAVGASPVITDLNVTARELSGVEMVDSISNMILTTPVQEWDNRTQEPNSKREEQLAYVLF